MKPYPASRKEDIVVQKLEDEVLIYDLKENRAFCLNETSALVWQMCDGNKSVTEISQAISQKLKSPATEDFVWLAIDQLKKENLIANSEEIVPDFNGLSRREVIKKVGLGTMIALPLISSLVAPTASQAASAGRMAACITPVGGCSIILNIACVLTPTCPNGLVLRPAIGVCVCVVPAGLQVGQCQTTAVCV
jgi:hypothetical protein